MGLPAEAARQRRRAETTVQVIGYLLVLMSAAPVAFYFAPRVEDQVLQWIIDAGRGSAEDPTNLRSILDAGTTMVQLWAAGPALLAVAVLWWVRRRRSARFVAAFRAGDDPRSWTGPITAAMWAIVAVGACLVGIVNVVGTAAAPEGIGLRFSQNPLWMSLTPTAFVLGGAFSFWLHRARHEVAPLLASGHAVFEDPPEPPEAPSFRQGVRTFAVAVAVEAAFVVAGAIAALIDHDAGGDAIGVQVLSASVVVPGAAAIALLLVFRMTPFLRFIVRDAWEHPLVRRTRRALVVGLALTMVGAVGAPSGRSPTTAPEWVFMLVLIAGGVLLLGALVVAAVTGLYLQDLGPQPWCGGLVLITVYWLGFTGDDGETVLPATPLSWLVAVGAGGLVARELVELARSSYGRTRLLRPLKAVTPELEV